MRTTVEVGAEFVEFRLDLYDLSEAEMHELFTNTPKHILQTCRLADEKVSFNPIKKKQ